MTEGFVAIEILIGVNDDLVNLRRETAEHVLHHRLSVQLLQPLVDAAHASAKAASEDDAAHAVHAKILRLSLHDE
jgi:hypothetical protein